MKKQNLLKLAFTMLAMIVMTGANAQILEEYEEQAAGVSTYHTKGKVFRLYVEPDLVYSPSYNATTNENLGATARWVWNFPAGIGTANRTSEVLANGAGVNFNWVEFSATNEGTYTVSVVEKNTIVDCFDAGITQEVVITGEPVATIAGSNALDGAGDPIWNETVANHEFDACGDQAAETLTIEITENLVPAGMRNYAFSISKRVINIDINDNEIDADDLTAGVQPISDALIADHTTASKLAVAAATTTVTTDAITVLNDLRTKYTFTLKKASDLDAGLAEGIVSQVSHKSDYLALLVDGTNFTTYPFSGTFTVEYIVNPEPVTGPIYHIPNNWTL